MLEKILYNLIQFLRSKPLLLVLLVALFDLCLRASNIIVNVLDRPTVFIFKKNE